MAFKEVLEFNDKPLGDVSRESVEVFLKLGERELSVGSYSNFLKNVEGVFRDFLERGPTKGLNLNAGDRVVFKEEGKLILEKA